MPKAADPIALFLKKQSFKCKALRATLTPEQCADRQLREVETKMFGRKLIVNNSSFDVYCRSGCCETGMVYLRKLRYKAWVLRAREKNKRVRVQRIPCKPLGEQTCAV